jgi:hypothetical protein
MFASIAAATLLIAGWYGIQAPTQLNPLDALAQAEARWEKVKPLAYEFDVEVRCLCVGLLQKPASFRVNGSEVRPLQDLQPAARQTYAYYDTVEKLFEAIRRSLARGQYKVSIEYDADLGYPVKADIDPKEKTFDAELFFKVTRLRKIGSAGAKQAIAAERGQALREFVTEALQEKLAARADGRGAAGPWMRGFGQLRPLRRETARIQHHAEFGVMAPR